MHKKTPVVFISHPRGIIAGPRESIDFAAEILECETNAREMRRLADEQVDIADASEQGWLALGGATHRHRLFERHLSALLLGLAYIESAETFDAVAAKLREESLR